jgi:dynein intermediate chain 1, axonemal
VRSSKGGEATVHSDECGWSLKILERMVVQNAQDELFSDFRYWEDESDQFKPAGMGTLLPLWRLADARAKKKMVTSIATNPLYGDLVAVSYGSYDFMRQGTGLIAVYSLKNPSYPEYTFTLDSGAMCLAFHPTQQALLAVGCYDGTVKVYDIRRREDRPLYSSDIRSGKHTDPVWEVRWLDDGVTKDCTFVSISSDGQVASWVLSKNELQMETLVSLKLVQSAPATAPGETIASGEAETAASAAAAGAPVAVMEDEGALTGLAGGSCFDFNPFAQHLFLVGTEEGRIHKCSKAYTGQYLETYEGHSMAVYSVRWSPFHERVFLSCSADWTVKLWDHLCQRAVATFDLETSVGDICWAPYSSTVFSAVASNGKAYVFDLSVDKHDERCVQKIVKKAKLTHVAFARDSPSLIVGDSSGYVNVLKLSPNLRKITNIPVPEVKKGETPPPPPSRLEVEIAKLNAIMLGMDVRASVPIDTITGRPTKAKSGETAAAAAAAVE